MHFNIKIMITRFYSYRLIKYSVLRTSFVICIVTYFVIENKMLLVLLLISFIVIQK